MPLWHLPTPLKERGDLHPNPYGPSRLAPVSNCNLPVAMIIPLQAEYLIGWQYSYRCIYGLTTFLCKGTKKGQAFRPGHHASRICT